MNIPLEIAKQLERLPPSKQEQVLRFVVSLTAVAPIGEKGTAFRAFSGSLDSVSAQEIREAIEKECERVDRSQW
ncbi:MAG: hypothetical protein ACKV2U_17680 [Bryobacteraceae bacterium]